MVHFLEDRGSLKPRMQLEATNAERIVQVLQRPSAEPIQRDRKRTNFHFAHFKTMLNAHQTLHAFGRIIGIPALQPKAWPNCGRLATTPLMRSSTGECGSVM